VTLRVRLGNLSPDDVSVEVRHGTYSASGEIREGLILAAAHEKREGDEEIYRVEVPCEISGRYGFAARIVPRHTDLIDPFTPLLLAWEPIVSGG
jgi:starch phosphorylase